ncbi:MAG: hypothetical protein K0R08_653 [Solimicrobium sp.]|jgi:hypothetical protein|nr:hypothetical protein [Solimicrobium sp.]
MNTTLRSRLTQFLQQVQHNVFAFFDEIDAILMPKVQEVVIVLKMLNIGRFIERDYVSGFAGRSCKGRLVIARASVVKAVLNLPTTEAFQVITIAASIFHLNNRDRYTGIKVGWGGNAIFFNIRS